MIERTFDYRIIKKIATWQPVISSKVIYLIDGLNGVWVFHEHLDGLMAHIEMSPECRGKEAVEKSKQALQWIFEKTPYTKVYAEIPKKNKPACHNAARIGFKFMKEENNKRFYEVTQDAIR